MTPSALLALVAVAQLSTASVQSVVAAHAPSATRVDEVIGEWGTTIDLAGNWRRSTMDLEVPGAQFMGRRALVGSFAVVDEVRGVLDEIDDLELVVAAAIDGIEMMCEGFQSFDYRVDERGGVPIVSRACLASLGGMDLCYVVAAVGKGRLGATLLWWGLPGLREKGEEEVMRLARSAVFPAEGTAWAELDRTRSLAFVASGHPVRIGVRDSLWRGLDELDDALVALRTFDLRAFLFVLTNEESTSAEEALGGALEVLADPEEQYVVEDRFDVEIGGRSGKGLTAYSEIGKASVWVAAVPLDDGSYLDIRLLFDGRPDSIESVRRELIGSIEIDAAIDLDAFPPWTPEIAPLGRTARELIDASELIGHVPNSNLAYIGGLGGIVGVGGNGLWHFDPTTGRGRELWFDEWMATRSASAQGDRVVVERSDGRYVRVDSDGDERPVRATGTGRVLLSSVGNTEVRLEQSGSVRAPGLLGDPLRARHSTLAVGGKQTWAGELGEVSRLVASGEHALFVHMGDTGSWAAVRVDAVRLADGATTSCGIWQYLAVVAPAPDGWLVTGQPLGGQRGVHEVGTDGSVALLLGGYQIEGMGIDATGRLLFAEGWTSNTFEDGDYAVRAIALDTARRLGPRCEPPAASELEEVARSVFGAAIPADAGRADLDRFDAALRAAWLERFGSGAPDTADELDQLVRATAPVQIGTQAARALAWVLVLTHAARNGAEIVGTIDLAKQEAALSAHASTSFALALHPNSFGANWMLRRIEQEALGRTVLIGVPSAELDARVQSAGEPDALRGLDRAARADLAALLERNSGNKYLRREVAARLVELDRAEVALALLETYARATDADAIDLAAWLAVRVSRADTAPGPADQLVRAARSAVERHRHDLVLYYLLGCAYELRGGEFDVERARACFDLVLELDEDYGELYDAADAAFGRLEGR